jgi:hypothetical protein
VAVAPHGRRHLEENWLRVTLVDNPQINRLKAKLGALSAFASRQTAETEDYVIEGHVPADTIHRLLRDRPKADGSCRAGYTDRLAGNGSRGNAA